MSDASDAILSQLQPFNEARFDVCMAYLCQAHGGSPLTLFDMVKLHVMTDVFHTVKHGRPVIGGSLNAWKFGPVVPDAFNRLRHWGYQYEEDGRQPENFDIVERRNNRIYFKPTVEVDLDDFSESELAAMNAAWDVVKRRNKSWNQLQSYFHDPVSPIGEAWNKAWCRQSEIDWRDLLDAWERQERTDLSDIKAIVA